MSPRARKQTQTLTSTPEAAGTAAMAPPSASAQPSRMDRSTYRAWLQAEREIDDEA